MPRADRHNEIELNLVKSGSLTYLLGGTQATIPAGRLAAFWAAVPHQVIAATDRAEYYVATIPLVWFLQCQFCPHFVDTILHAQLVIDPEPQTRNGDQQMFERWVRDLKDSDPTRSRIAFLEIEARLLRFALALQKETGPTPSPKAAHFIIDTGGFNRVQEMAGYIARHFAEPLSATQIARVVGLHPNYAMTLFKKVFGMTLIEFVIQHRISNAQRLLATTDEKILDVALNSGFASLSCFHYTFKRLCHCSPGEYRKAHQIKN